MTATPQRFPLPNIPFRRELHSGCAIGTSIICTAQAFEAKPKTFSIQLISANDIAILVTVPIAKSGQITASARVDGRFIGEVEKPIFLPIQTKFTLRLHVAQRVIETYFNNDHIMDFVHRVNPSEIKAVAIEGPLIVDEVVFTPPQGACLDPLPTYEEATGSSINPVPELRYMNIGPPAMTSSSAPAQPAPLQIGFSTSVTTQPTTGLPLQPPHASFVPNASGIVPNCFPRGEQPAFYLIEGQDASKSRIHEKSPQKFVPTAFQQSRSYPFSNTPSVLATSSSSNLQLGVSQAFISGSVLPGTSYPQQAMPQPNTSTPQYPFSYAEPQPYVHPQFPSVFPTISGTQIHPQYNLYQQRPPFQYPPIVGPVGHVGPYTHGYVANHYGTHPIYGSICHSHRRSNSCCSDC